MQNTQNEEIEQSNGPMTLSYGEALMAAGKAQLEIEKIDRKMEKMDQRFTSNCEAMAARGARRTPEQLCPLCGKNARVIMKFFQKNMPKFEAVLAGFKQRNTDPSTVTFLEDILADADESLRDIDFFGMLRAFHNLHGFFLGFEEDYED